MVVQEEYYGIHPAKLKFHSVLFGSSVRVGALK